MEIELELSSIMKLIECPVCQDVPIPPIYNCENGHSVCSPCSSQLTSPKCPYCLANMTQMRNYPVESLVSTPTIKCDNFHTGCTQKYLNLSEYEDHVRNCNMKIQQTEKATQTFDTLEVVEGDDSRITPCPNCNYENSSHCRKDKCHLCDFSIIRSGLFPAPKTRLKFACKDCNLESEYEYFNYIWRELELTLISTDFDLRELNRNRIKKSINERSL